MHGGGVVEMSFDRERTLLSLRPCERRHYTVTGAADESGRIAAPKSWARARPPTRSPHGRLLCGITAKGVQAHGRRGGAARRVRGDGAGGARHTYCRNRFPQCWQHPESCAHCLALCRCVTRCQQLCLPMVTCILACTGAPGGAAGGARAGEAQQTGVGTPEVAASGREGGEQGRTTAHEDWSRDGP
eukprot:scaffold1419_cov410-Prasinococcus_capsulatus_cf.AAC.2